MLACAFAPHDHGPISPSTFGLDSPPRATSASMAETGMAVDLPIFTRGSAPLLKRFQMVRGLTPSIAAAS